MDRGKLGSEFVSHQVFESLTRRWGRWLVMYADHYSRDSGAKILLHHQMWTRVPWFSHWYFLQPPTMAFVCLEYDKRRQIVCSSRFLQRDGHNCILHKLNILFVISAYRKCRCQNCGTPVCAHTSFITLLSSSDLNFSAADTSQLWPANIKHEQFLRIYLEWLAIHSFISHVELGSWDNIIFY